MQTCKDIIDETTEDVINLAVQYGRIGTLDTLSCEDIKLMEEILDRALNNEILSFWISEMDHILAHELDLFEEGWLDNHKDWTALLREYAGKSIPKTKPVVDMSADDLTKEFNISCDTSTRECVTMGY